MAVFSAALPFTHSKKLDTQENLSMFTIKETLGAPAIVMPTLVNLAILFKLVQKQYEDPFSSGHDEPTSSTLSYQIVDQTRL